jgi:hypothetical protein
VLPDLRKREGGGHATVATEGEDGGRATVIAKVGEEGRARVAAEGEEGGGEREARRTREKRVAAVSVGAGWVWCGWEEQFGGRVGRLAQ